MHVRVRALLVHEHSQQQLAQARHAAPKQQLSGHQLALHPHASAPVLPSLLLCAPLSAVPSRVRLPLRCSFLLKRLS